MVPGDPKAAPGSPVYEYGSQVANLKNLSVVDLTGRITQVNKIDMAIYMYILRGALGLGGKTKTERAYAASILDV